MPEFYKSKSGLRTARHGKIHIHSSINPQKEAEKFVSEKLKSMNGKPSIILLIFPGLNYIYPILKKAYPDTRIISIYVHKEFHSNSDTNIYLQDPFWFPETGLPLKQFLYSNISEHDIGNIATFTWEPVIRAFPDEVKKHYKTIEQVLTEYNSNISTTRFFGKRYLKNIIRNLFSINTTFIPEKINKPTVIAGAGPSLTAAINLIKNLRERIFLVALSSSLAALNHQGIYPDMIIATDPGFYSSFHLNYNHYARLPVAAPLTAYLPETARYPLLILNQGSFTEKYFLEKLSLPVVNVPPNGTVSGSAVFLTSVLAAGPVILCGIDFCANDILTHCRPHSFDYFFAKNSCRYDSTYGRYYSNMVTNYRKKIPGDPGARASGQLSAYSGWFSTTLFNDNYYRLNPSAVAVKGIKPVDNDMAREIILSADYAGDNNYFIYQVKELNVYRNILIDSVSELIKSLDSYLSGNTTNKGFIHELLYSYDADSFMKTQETKNNGNGERNPDNLLSIINECSLFLKKELNKASNAGTRHE